MVLARAIVRDIYAGEAAGQMLARMSAIMGLVPAIAPIMGGMVQRSFGWESNFLFMSAGGFIIGLLTWFKFPETLPPERRVATHGASIALHFQQLIKDARFRRYLFISALSFAGIFAYISGASFVLQGIYGLTPVQFGMCFGTMVLGFIAGSTASARYGGRYGIDGMLKIGTSLILGGSLLLIGWHLADERAVTGIVLPITLYAAGIGITMPQSMAGALTPFPQIAGTASALIGFLQSVFAALVGFAVGHALSYGAWPMLLAILLMGVLSYLATAIGPARHKT